MTRSPSKYIGGACVAAANEQEMVRIHRVANEEERQELAKKKLQSELVRTYYPTSHIVLTTY
jgi:hypothetical protein